MRKVLFLFCLSLVLAAPPVTPGSEGSMTLFRIGTGGVGGTYYPIGLLIGSIISRPPGAPSCSDGTPCGVAGLLVILRLYWHRLKSLFARRRPGQSESGGASGPEA